MRYIAVLLPMQMFSIFLTWKCFCRGWISYKVPPLCQSCFSGIIIISMVRVGITDCSLNNVCVLLCALCSNYSCAYSLHFLRFL